MKQNIETIYQKRNTIKKYIASIIIPVSDNCTILEYFIKDLQDKINIYDYQIIFVVDGPVSSNILELLHNFSLEYSNVISIQLTTKSSYAHVNNYGRTFAESELLIFMNTDIFLQKNCLKSMIDALYQNNVHAVQPLLIYPQNNCVQSTGHIFGDCYNRHALKEQSINHPLVKLSSNRQALSLALCLIPASIFDECGGFDEYYYNGWEGLDLTLKITQRGYTCWYESNARAYHVEGGSRKKFSLNESLQAGHFWSNWGKIVKHDITDILTMQLKEIKLSSNYIVYNFTTYRSWGPLLDSLNFIYDDIIDKTKYSNESSLDFYNVLSYHALTVSNPIIFLVSSFTSLRDNTLWVQYRENNQDIFIDLSGNIGMLKTIVCGN